MTLLIIGCALIVAWFVYLLWSAPLAHEDDERGFVLGDWPHVPEGIGNLHHHDEAIKP